LLRSFLSTHRKLISTDVMGLLLACMCRVQAAHETACQGLFGHGMHANDTASAHTTGVRSGVLSYLSPW
jgi:hypothetical protein